MVESAWRKAIRAFAGRHVRAQNDQNPRKAFDKAVDYAIQVSNGYLDYLNRRSIKIKGLRYLEIGAGADFAPQLVLASLGAKVTVADRYLATWDPEYHPRLYEEFLRRWNGPADAVRRVLQAGGYDRVIQLAHLPAERLAPLETASFDFVQSNAVLEHVSNIRQTVLELARVTTPGGIHAHQVDFRWHGSFDRPLDHLLLSSGVYRRARLRNPGGLGTAMRLPELIEAFTRDFWVWDISVNCTADLDYVAKVQGRLPDHSPYKHWPVEVLRQTGACIWLVRKDHAHMPKHAENRGKFWAVSTMVEKAAIRIRDSLR